MRNKNTNEVEEKRKNKSDEGVDINAQCWTGSRRPSRIVARIVASVASIVVARVDTFIVLLPFPFLLFYGLFLVF